MGLIVIETLIKINTVVIEIDKSNLAFFAVSYKFYLLILVSIWVAFIVKIS